MEDSSLSIIVCGSIAAVAAPSYLAWLRQEVDVPLRVLLTHSAQRFVTPQVIGWHADETYTSDDPDLNPTEFARRSLGVVVLPATANTLAAAALGLAGTPAQTALLAGDRPALFFPNMNSTMWAKKSTQRNVEALRADGHVVVEPVERPVFELWNRTNIVGLTLPTPDSATETIIGWLESIVAGLPDTDPAPVA
ncbi:MAG TPA: flavoprotein [Pseudonocardiaceae bacterium]|nr:flavoprotein [Pseudonocardiaceae bacterium]